MEFAGLGLLGEQMNLLGGFIFLAINTSEQCNHSQPNRRPMEHSQC